MRLVVWFFFHSSLFLSVHCPVVVAWVLKMLVIMIWLQATPSCSYGKEIFILILIAFTGEGGCRRRRKLSLFLMPTNTRGCYRHQEPSILFNTTNDIPARQQILICRYCSVVLWSAIPPSETIARGSTLLLRVVGRLPLPHHPLQCFGCSFWPGIALIIN